VGGEAERCSAGRAAAPVLDEAGTGLPAALGTIGVMLIKTAVASL
jgi:hypothetical protein